MNNAFLRATRYAKSLLVSLGVLFSVFSGALHATVTWDGTNGVANWLKSSTRWEPSTTNGCLSCHTGGSLALDTFSAATSSPMATSSTEMTRALEIVRRVETLPRSDSDCMPATAIPCPSVVDTDLVSTWVSQSGGPVENAPPSAQTNSASSIDRTGATLEGDVNANGLTTTYIFEWGLDDGGMNFTDQTPPPLPSTPTTNGGLNPETVSQTITGLDCETDYQFRVGATNDASTPAGSYTYGSTQSFATAACNFPVVRFGGSEVSGVGQTVSIPIILEGDTSTVYTYPTNIHYQISGTAAQGDIDIVSGTLPINSPDTSANLTFNIINNTMAPADETVVIEVTGATDSSGSPSATVPGPSTYTVVITGTNTAPSLPPLQVSQDGLNTQLVYKNKGNVTITANDGAGQFAYDWNATAALLPGEASGNQYTFDPSVPSPGLTSGPYVVSVAIDDGQQITHQTVTLWVDESAPSLSCDLPDDDADGNAICDEIEGYGDFDFDGLPDYLDPIGDPSLLNSEVSSTGDNHARLIVTTAGLSLALNDTAVERVASGDATGAKLSADDVVDDPEFSSTSGIFDFQIRGLSELQRTAQVVIPLDNPMPPNARYRKLINGVWSDFVETSTDGIRSARSDEVSNECPPPGDLTYEDGLIAFNDCLELTLTDGGRNDEDGEANGVIKDPGTVVLPASLPSGPTTSPDASSSPGGAGALDWWWLMIVTPLLWLPYRLKKGQVND